MFYLNQLRNFIINSEITEWDIKSGNTSIMQEYNLAPIDKIEKIKSLSKSDRVVTVGKMMKKDKDFSKNLEEGFDSAVNNFIEINDLDKEFDILSIKRDAVFVVARTINRPNIGEHIKFVQKNSYHAYIYLKPFELYFGRNNIDIKGLSDNLYDLHKDGMILFLERVVEICEGSNMKMSEINSFLKDFVEKYKKRELDYEFYREFNNSSKFKCILFGDEVLLDNVDDSIFNKVNIEYNYTNIILPLINLIC